MYLRLIRYDLIPLIGLTEHSPILLIQICPIRLCSQIDYLSLSLFYFNQYIRTHNMHRLTRHDLISLIDLTEHALCFSTYSDPADSTV